MATLFRDLADRGLLDTTLVVVTGEFGRTPRINKNAGRDHWGPAFTVALGGGGIKGGRVVGKTRRPGREAGRRAARPRRPGRHDLSPAGHQPERRVPHARRPPGEDRQRRPGDQGADLDVTARNGDNRRWCCGVRAWRRRIGLLLLATLSLAESRRCCTSFPPAASGARRSRFASAASTCTTACSLHMAGAGRQGQPEAAAG